MTYGSYITVTLNFLTKRCPLIIRKKGLHTPGGNTETDNSIKRQVAMSDTALVLGKAVTRKRTYGNQVAGDIFACLLIP